MSYLSHAVSNPCLSHVVSKSYHATLHRAVLRILAVDGKIGGLLGFVILGNEGDPPT